MRFHTTHQKDTMSRKTITSSSLVAIVAALGLAVGLQVSPARADDSLDYRDLPSQGFTLTVIPDLTHTPICLNVWAQGNGSPLTLLGDPDPTHLCQTDAAMLARVAALKAAYPPVTTTAVTTTSATNTTTEAAPPATTPTTTDVQPPAAPIAVPPTVTVTTTIVDPNIDARLSALEAYYAALAVRVGALESANVAAQTAYDAAKANGATDEQAALIARSAGWNAIYQLG